MEPDRVLVAYGTKRGSTKEIAEAIGDELRGAGLPTDVAAADAVRDVSRYGAVVLGGALYMGRWHPAARAFGRRFAQDLRAMRVWVFSSGPLDRSAAERAIDPVGSVRKLMTDVGARGHATFGGSLSPDATGFPAKAMAKRMAGDNRDFDGIRTWAHGIAQDLLPYTAAA